MEIVIENPVESPPPPPPPPPPPLQPLTMSSWNAIVTAPQTTFASSSIANTSMPAATTVMTITIAENPTATPTYPPPVRFSYRETYAAANPLPVPGDLYSLRRAQPRGRSYDDPDGASPSVRRIDKSGLLGISEPEASSLRAGLRSPRFIGGMNNVASGMLSPRRFECVGQLDPVPEVPGQATRANVAPGASNVFPVTSSGNAPIVSSMATMLGQERREAARLDSCETLSIVNLGRPTKSASFDSLEPRHRNVDVGSTMQPFDRDLDGIESSSLQSSTYTSSFRLQENCEARGRTLGRLSRLALSRNDEAFESVSRYSETCCNFPFSVRAPTTFPGFEESSSLPSTRATTTTGTTSTTTVAVATMKETDRSGKEEEDGVSKNHRPEEERAEAEGCEHGSSRNPLKDESAQRSDEFVDNDGIQTLRVIILSEQL